MQPVKGLLNLPTLGAAGATAYGAGKMATDAKGTEYAMLRSKQGAKQLAIAGTAGALLIPGNGLLSKIGRGVALGLMVHGVAVIATDKDLAGNDVTFETNAEVAGGYGFQIQDGGGYGGGRNYRRG
jgi:hypothetical protein